MAYLYETHLHTCQASACGKSPGREHIALYKRMGYQGIIVTDHFFGGNTAVPRELPWRERIDLFCSGYEDALAEGQRQGLDVFFGWEQGYGDDEYLIYGLDKAWLYAHPEIEHATRREQLALVHGSGGCVVQAHPFRMRGYMRYIRLGRDYADAAEVANAGNEPVNDAYAYRYAKELGCPMTAGSDNHHSAADDPAPALMGVCIDEKLTCIQDYVRVILQHKPIGLYVPKGRFDADESQQKLESYWIDSNEALVPTHRYWA